MLLAIISLFFTLSAIALPQGQVHALNEINFTLPDASYDFEGIVKLSNCSGSLIAFSGEPMTNKARVMTNGHCIQKPGGFLRPGEVLQKTPSNRMMRIYDHNFKMHWVRATKIIYATMTNTDVAFYELEESFQDLLTRTSIHPFMLDMNHPLSGTSIDIISGYWDRGYSCEIDGLVFKLQEADWTFTDSIRYTPECDTIGGTSGSPIIARGERRVIAINNTSNENGRRCTLDNPCEVSEQGEVTVRKGTRYGQQTYQIYSCLSPDYQFDLTKAECRLPH